MFFAEISSRLKPNGLLASADLASDTGSPEYDVLLKAWMNMMSAGGITPENLARMRHAYQHDVGVMSPESIADVIKSGGFDLPVLFYQAGLIHAWRAVKSPEC